MPLLRWQAQACLAVFGWAQHRVSGGEDVEQANLLSSRGGAGPCLGTPNLFAVRLCSPASRPLQLHHPTSQGNSVGQLRQVVLGWGAPNKMVCPASCSHVQVILADLVVGCGTALREVFVGDFGGQWDGWRQWVMADCRLARGAGELARSSKQDLVGQCACCIRTALCEEEVRTAAVLEVDCNNIRPIRFLAR
jgi:hypothetical protein